MPGKDLFAAPPETKAEKPKGKDLFATSQSPFIQKGIDMVNAPDRQTMRASLPAATAPDRMQNRTDSAVLAKARKVEQDIANATRKARVKPVEREAGRAGAAQLDQGPITANPNAAYSEFMLPPDAQRGLEAERGVYRANDVTSSLDAATLRGVNSLALGIPAMVNEDFRNEIGAAGRDQPGASLAGDIAGYLIPGELAWQAGRAGYNATVRPIVNAIMPQGGSALARGTRLAGRTGEQAAGWAGQNALFQGSVGASTQAAEEGRPVTLSDVGGGVASGATDPFNIVGPTALIGANRFLTFLRTGGVSATPARIAEEVSLATGGRADTAETAAAQILDFDREGSPFRPQAIARVVRELEAGGLSRENITGLFQAVQQRLRSLPEGQAGRLTFGQALTEALERDFPQAAENILGTLRERRLTTRKGDRSPGIAGQVSRELRETQGAFLGQSANRNLGGDQVAGVRAEMQAARDELGTQYENLFDQLAGQPVTEDLTRALDFYGTKNDLMRPLRMIADGQMINLDDLIRNDPRRAAHWLQSAAREQADQAAARGDNAVARAYRSMRDNLLQPLQRNAPGYQNVRSAYGSVEEIDTALDAGRRFLTRSERPGDLAEFMGELEALSPEARTAALASIRDEITTLIGRAGEEAPARISQLTSANALRTLESLGPEGVALADDLRFIAREQRFLNSFDPNANSRTALNAQAVAGAQSRGNSPVANLANNIAGPGTVTQDAIISTVAGQPLPLMTAKRGAGALMQSVFGPRIRTLEDQTRFYMSRMGNIPGPPEAPDFSGPRPPPPPNALATPPAGGRSFSRDESGFVNYPVSNALLGGSGGATYGSFNDVNRDGKVNWEDQAGGAIIGTVGGAGLGKVLSDVSMRTLMKNKPAKAQSEPPVSIHERIAKGESVEISPMSFDVAQSIRLASTDDVVKQAKTLDDAWNAIYSLVSRTGQSQGLRRKLNDELVPEVGHLDIMMGAVPERFREELARRFLRKYPAQWRILYDAWPSNVDGSPVTGKRSVLELVEEEAPQFAFQARNAPQDFRKLVSDAANQIDGTQNAPQASADILPMKPRPQGFGIPTSVGDAAISGLMGSGTGSVMGSQYDLNGDGEINALDMQIGAGAGMAAFMGGPRAYGMAKNALAGVGKTVGRAPKQAGSAAPATPQQAARFETPGSPEYEAAVAKGLDMSTPARMARAKQEGYKTDEILYHGTQRNFDAFDVNAPTSWDRTAGGGIYLTDNPRVAGSFAQDFGDEIDGSQILPVFVKSTNARTINANGKVMSYQQIRAAVDEAKAKGHDSLVIKNVKDSPDPKAPPSTVRVVFDPANIRSVHAAFDPDKAASPILTAGFGGGRRPPPDSPDAIREGVQGITDRLRSSAPTTPPANQTIAPRGNMRGVIEPPPKLRAVPPPPPPMPPPPRYRGSNSSAPNAIEIGLMAATAGVPVAFGAMVADRLRNKQSAQGANR